MTDKDFGSLRRKSGFVPTCTAVLIAALLAGCEPVTSTPEPQTVARVAGEIAYFRDARTGLCFASVSSASYSAYRVLSIANVPCEAAGLATTASAVGTDERSEEVNQEILEEKPE
jgi:hypothetical protein